MFRDYGSLDQAGVVGHHDGEDGEDGDGADVDHDLGESDELRAELQIEGGDARESDGEGEHAVHGVAKAHGCGGSANGDHGQD